MEPAHRQVPILEAAGAVGAVQVAIGLAVLAYALLLALHPPRERRAAKFAAGLVAAFLPVVLGHAALLVVQVRTLSESRGLPAAEGQDLLVRGMESASVHTWIGWTVSGIAFAAVLLARLRRSALRS